MTTHRLNLEDKLAWCEQGANDEHRFVSEIAGTYGLHAEINPQKEYLPDGKYLPDLFVNGVMSDLKHVTTPFYTAHKYGFNPARTITFNLKDMERYSTKYPYIRVYFWVEWDESSEFGVTVPALSGLWVATIPKLLNMKFEHKMAVHHYERRKNDVAGNARSSYLIDIDTLCCVGAKQ